jgi:hypothetical protein
MLIITTQPTSNNTLHQEKKNRYSIFFSVNKIILNIFGIHLGWPNNIGLGSENVLYGVN